MGLMEKKQTVSLYSLSKPSTKTGCLPFTHPFPASSLSSSCRCAISMATRSDAGKSLGAEGKGPEVGWLDVP